MPAGRRAAAAMLRSGDPASPAACQRAIEAVTGSGVPGYGEAALDGDLGQSFEAIRSALNQDGAKPAAPFLRMHHEIQVGPVLVLPFRKFQPVPSRDRPLSRFPGLASHQPCFPGVAARADGQPAAERRAGQPRFLRAVGTLSRQERLAAPAYTLRVRQVNSLDAHPSSQPRLPHQRHRIFRRRSPSGDLTRAYPIQRPPLLRGLGSLGGGRRRPRRRPRRAPRPETTPRRAVRPAPRDPLHRHPPRSSPPSAAGKPATPP